MLTRLVRGLGSPKAQVRAVYYSILVVILSRLNDKTWFNLDKFKDIVDKELSQHCSKSVSTTHRTACLLILLEFLFRNIGYFRFFLVDLTNLTVNLQEEGDILSGKVLSYGAMIRSGHFSTASVNSQQCIIAELLNNMKSRSYLPLLTYKFLAEGINKVSKLGSNSYSYFQLYTFLFLFFLCFSRRLQK